jgi:Bacterial regulatory proteins, luxR family
VRRVLGDKRQLISTHAASRPVFAVSESSRRITMHTVKRHIANAYGKLGVTHRTEAVARVNELKLL